MIIKKNKVKKTCKDVNEGYVTKYKGGSELRLMKFERWHMIIKRIDYTKKFNYMQDYHIGYQLSYNANSVPKASPYPAFVGSPHNLANQL